MDGEHGYVIYTLLYGLIQFRVTLVPMVYSVIGTTMFDWWSLQMDIISSVDHSGRTRSKMDDMRKC